MVIKIAICGKLRAGKDTVCDHLVERYGFTRFAFGDGIRRFAHEVFPWVPTDPKPRKLYQFMNVMREYDEDVWVRHCFGEIERHEVAYRTTSMITYSGENIPPFYPVITDIRQQNEFDRCRAEGYTVIRVNADDDLRLERAKAAGDRFTAEDLAHETEKYVDSFAVDYEIYNSGDVTDTYTQIGYVMRELGVEKLTQ